MSCIRFSKAFLVLLISLFCLLVGYNNIADYEPNYNFVRHVMLMDTTVPDNHFKGRSIATPALHHGAYWLIIAGELTAGLLCLAGSLRLFRRLGADRRVFMRAKTWSVAGLTLGIFVWFFGFMTVGAEWFFMWQSQEWNGTQGAFRFVMCLSVVLIYLVQAEAENEHHPHG